jgi:hypothetical protein
MRTRFAILCFALVLAVAAAGLDSPAPPPALASTAPGPTLEVTGDLIGPIVTNTTATPVTEINVAPGTPMSFCLTADASGYGGVVAGYRTGWDITDPDDDNAWGMPFTPFPTPTVCTTAQVFLAGSHMFYAEVIDDAGIKSRVPILAHVLAPTPVEESTWGQIKALYSE